jgi:hypothetical protein
MTAKKIKKVPMHVPGQGMAEFVRRSAQWIKSDSVAYDGDTTVDLFELPGNSLVVNTLVQIQTAFDASGSAAAAAVTITVPNDTGTETVFNGDSTNTLLQSTGFKAATGYALLPASGGLVQANLEPGTTTGGAFEVYMEYIVFGDKLG